MSTPTCDRHSTGITALDGLLGGGLLPGTLTVVVGASGIGKTQFGLQYLDAGRAEDGRRGILFDMTARVDSQGHFPYAERLFAWPLAPHPSNPFVPDTAFDEQHPLSDYLHVFDQSGRRVTQAEAGFDDWHDWQVELAAQLELTIDFFYSNFVRGARRVVVDGIEPAQRPNESIQHELFSYVYHQILRKDSQWVARDLFRQAYRTHAKVIEQNAYDHRRISAMLLVTSHESLLEPLIERPLVDGDVLATANTLIYLGKVREGKKLTRALYVAKHRGSGCSDGIHPYTISGQGLQVSP